MLGYKLKHPFGVKKHGTAIILVGATGTGKTGFVEMLFDKAFGSNYVVKGASNRDVTTGLFNGFLEGKFLVQLDDSTGNKSFVQGTRFKQLITENKMMIRSQGHTSEANNNLMMLFTMNGDLARYLEHPDNEIPRSYQVQSLYSKNASFLFYSLFSHHSLKLYDGN